MIQLRDVRPEDKDRIREWRNLPAVRQYMLTDHIIAAEEHSRWFEKIGKDPAGRYWIIQRDGQGVGLIHLYDINERHKRCYWGFYIVNPELRGKGVGSFAWYCVLKCAFEELQLNKVCSEVLASNQASVEMHKGFGFVQEGVCRQHVLKDGIPVDVIALGMLRQEWLKNKAAVEGKLRARGLI